mmetsp:Transcript_48986/g.74511  ORF Transcript_48986/g.74511 Transcript_48986/m.74511 type:complete len:228 (+) Transcript_48986:70-753(+)
MPYDKVIKKVDQLDPLDGLTFHAFFSPEEWGDDFPILFNNLRSFRGFCNLPNLEATDAGYKVIIDAPNIKKEDIKVELVGHESLVITATAPAPALEKDSKKKLIKDKTPPKTPKKDASSEPTSTYSLWEEVSLPEDADVEKMKVKYDNKTLTVEFPKAEAKPDLKPPVVAKWRPDAKSAKLDEDVQKRMKHIEQLREELDQEWKAVMEAEGQIAEAKAKDRIPLTVE